MSETNKEGEGEVFIYRVQDRKGRGPWKPGFSSKWVEDRATEAEYDALAPPPVHVMLALNEKAAGKPMGYGCTSLDHLRLWFQPGEYQTLRRFGYRAVKMKVDQILLEMPTQCAFVRSLPLRMRVDSIELYPHP